MANNARFRERGVQLIKEAVEADNEGNLEQALSLYKQGLQNLVAAVKYERNKKSKQVLNAKVNEYMTRAEEIQAQLDGARNNRRKKKKVKASGSSPRNEDGENKEDDEDGDGEEKDPEIAKLEAALSNAIVSEKPNVKWSDVAGLEVAKGLLKEAVLLPIKFPQLFTGKRTPWRGILLYGPPGTGKSFLAKAVATEAGASTFFSVSSSDLVSKFQGESERLVRSLFDLARAKSPAIIFIDEIDSLCGNRSDGENDSARRIKTEFLVQMQGVGKGNDGILVLGATNTPWDLDPAIRRRFEKRIYIPLPDERARRRMFEVHIGKTPNTLEEDDFDELGDITEGFSGSDISVVVRDALMEPVRMMSQATHFRRVRNEDPDSSFEFLWEPCSRRANGATAMSLMDLDGDELATPKVTLENFRRVLESQKPSVSEGDIVRHEDWTQEFGQEG